MADTMDKSNLASMLRDYENRMNQTTNKSTLSQAIGENAVKAIEKAEPVANLLSAGMTVADWAGKSYPPAMGVKAAWDLARWGKNYADQYEKDKANYGKDASVLGTLFRSAPLIGGIVENLSGQTSRPDLDPAFRRYLASRDIDIGDWQGPPVVGPPPIAPVERGILAAPPGAKAAPWVNPNLPRESYDFGDYGSNVTDQASFDDFASDVGFGVFNKGGIASLIA